MEKQTKIEDGYLIETYASGHVVKMPVQADQPKAIEIEPEEIDLKTLSDESFKRIVLEKLGMKVKK